MKKSEVEALEKKKYPVGVEHYTLYEEIGVGGTASVHRALCILHNEIVAIKILDLERERCDLNNVSREAQTMVLVDHPNVVRSHCSFVKDHTLWVVMPFMAAGSCLHILKAAHPTGFEEEAVIATVLREVLKGLDYLHDRGFMHRDVKAGNILVDSRGRIQLGDLGVSACLYDCGDRQRSRNTFVGTPCWMAPEVMEQLHGYDFKADIWSFGITALELAHGHAPFSRYPPIKVLLMTLQNAPPGLDYESDKKFSRSFRQMISTCLVKDPTKRPTAKKLLKHAFFKKARSSEYIHKTLVEGLPAGLGDRVQMLKQKEEDMLAQKKMPDGKKEEISQKEYNRGISDWNFDLEVVKAQAALIQDDEIIAETPCSSATDAAAKYQRQMSSASQYSEVSDVDVLSETCSINGGDEQLEEKAKSCPVVQKKGRFKVTSESVDFEKVSPTVSVLHKSSLSAVSTCAAPLNDLSITGAIASAAPNQVYQTLQGILQSNIQQRESILLLMKQLSCGGGETSGASTNLAEKSSLEVAHDREKELIREVTDLQTRLMCAQKELQKVKNQYVHPDS